MSKLSQQIKKWISVFDTPTITTIAIFLTVILLMHIGQISVRECFKRLEDTGISQQRLSILTTLDQIKYYLSKAEASEIAYIWSNQKKYLDQYNANFATVDQHVAELDMRLHGKHRMISDEIREYIRVRRECAEEVIALRQKEGLEAAVAHGERLGEATVTKHLEVMVDDLANRADL